MKIYYIYKTYDSGDHEKGYYMSPFFTTREAAQKFLDAVIAKNKEGTEYEENEYGWYSDEYGHVTDPHLVEADVLNEFVKLEPAEDYLDIVYT